MTSSVLSRKTFFIAALALIPFLPILLAGVDYYHTADPLFDIQIYIPDRYTEILPGSELLASIRLVNLGGTRRVDVTLDYWIEGPDGRLILEKKETVAVETQANFVRAFDIPKSSSPGKYILYSRITYAGGLEASAEHSFDVVIERQKEIVNYMLIVVFLLIAAIYLFYRSVPLLRRAAVSFKVSGILKRKGIS